MKRSVAAFVMLSMTFGLSAPASAEEPYYFHKTGVTREAYLADVDYCAGLAGGVRGPDYNGYVYSSNMAVTAAGSVIAAVFSTLLERKARRRLVSQVERTCMADRGYERRSIDKVNHRAILDLDGEAKIDRMFALVAAEQPVGKVLVE